MQVGFQDARTEQASVELATMFKTDNVGLFGGNNTAAQRGPVSDSSAKAHHYLCHVNPKITWNNSFSVKPKRKNSQIK